MQLCGLVPLVLLLVPCDKVGFHQIVPVSVAEPHPKDGLRPAFVRFTLERFAPVTLARLALTQLMFAPLRLAFVKSARSRAPVRFAPLRSAPRSLAFVSTTELRSKPARFLPSRTTAPRFGHTPPRPQFELTLINFFTDRSCAFVRPIVF